MASPQSAQPVQPIDPPDPAHSTDLHVIFVLWGRSFLSGSNSLAQKAVASKTSNQISCNITDHDFFAWIRNEYFTRRGFWGVYLGLYKYNHCEFLEVSLKSSAADVEMLNLTQFQRFDEHQYTLRGPIYPNKRSTEYEFKPRPMKPNPPVPEEEFRHHFHQQSWLRTWLEQIKRRIHKQPTPTIKSRNDVIRDLIPKRISPLEEDDDRRETF